VTDWPAVMLGALAAGLFVLIVALLAVMGADSEWWQSAYRRAVPLGRRAAAWARRGIENLLRTGN
jgi:hypothetical protein